MNNLFKNFEDAVNGARSIAICSHVNPDGDAIGSSSGLYYILKALGKDVYLYKNDEFPTNLEFMKDKTEYLEEVKPVDLFIVTDVSSQDRIGSGIEVFKLSKNSICLDHHRTNGGLAKLNIIFPEKSSTCELIAEMVLDLGWEIDENAAGFLYLGMLTDTFRFLYEATSPKTLRIAAKLIELGANKQFIHQNLYERLDMNYHLLQAEVMKRAEFLAGGQVVIAKLDKKDLDKYKLDFDKTEGLVSILRTIEGVELSALVKEYGENDQKVSFRSKSKIDVSELAKEFGGGGHIRASGLTLETDLDHAYKIIKARLEKLIDEGNFTS